VLEEIEKGKKKEMKNIIGNFVRSDCVSFDSLKGIFEQFLDQKKKKVRENSLHNNKTKR